MATTAKAVSGRARASGGRGLHIALWIVQGLLALLFAGAGFTKMVTPLPDLAQTLPYTADLPGALVRFIGASEFVGALGLVTPSMLRVLPILTPLAGLGLMVVMVLAMLFHLSRGEMSDIVLPVVVAALAGFVAWGRFKAAPIAPRSR